MAATASLARAGPPVAVMRPAIAATVLAHPRAAVLMAGNHLAGGSWLFARQRGKRVAQDLVHAALLEFLTLQPLADFVFYFPKSCKEL